MLLDVTTEKIQFDDPEEGLVGVDDDAMFGKTFENYS